MLPLRFIAESSGFEVNWNANTQTITITSGGVNKETETISVQNIENKMKMCLLFI